jgi:hypothetical protein
MYHVHTSRANSQQGLAWFNIWTWIYLANKSPLSVRHSLNSTRTTHAFHFSSKIKFADSNYVPRQWTAPAKGGSDFGHINNWAHTRSAWERRVPFNLLMAIETQGWLNKLSGIDCGAEEEHFDRDHVVDSKLHLGCVRGRSKGVTCVRAFMQEGEL